MDWAVETTCAGKHACMAEDIVSGKRVQVHVARTRPYSDAFPGITDELKKVARTHDECGLRVADVPNIGRLDD